MVDEEGDIHIEHAQFSRKISIKTLNKTTKAPPEMAPPTLHLATTSSLEVQWQCAQDCLVGKFELQYMKIGEFTAATPTSQTGWKALCLKQWIHCPECRHRLAELRPATTYAFRVRQQVGEGEGEGPVEVQDSWLLRTSLTFRSLSRPFPCQFALAHVRAPPYRTRWGGANGRTTRRS